MCCADFDGRHIFGDLRSQTISEVWNSPVYRAARRQHLESGRSRNLPILRFTEERLASLDQETSVTAGRLNVMGVTC
jgi:hypothetical protein